HPPCTYLSNVGVQHLHKDFCRWIKMDSARVFFMKLWGSKIKKVCIENPIPHYYCGLPDYSQIVSPNLFGQLAMKKTCLWLRGLPLLKKTNFVKIPIEMKYRHPKRGTLNGSNWYHMLSPKERSKARSTMFEGIADAMADQWG
ncbi:MAG: hypothetical protein KJ941_10145, partial [Bacteroidetes bacterium]|nr:hypothetical protein [Bacteroidota bacterium]